MKTLKLAKTIKSLLWYTPFLMFAQFTAAQTQLLVGDELSQSYVYFTYQDSQGFMWLGTKDGLNRYDGKDVVVYMPNPDDPYALAGNGVMYIYEDRQNRLWVSTRRGLSVFDRQTSRFYNLQHDPNDPNSLPSNNVNAIVQDEQGFLWVGTADHLVRLTLSDSLSSMVTAAGKLTCPIQVFSPNEDFMHYENPAFIYPTSTKIWIGTDSEIGYLDLSLPLIERRIQAISDYVNIPNEPTFPLSIYQDSITQSWLGVGRNIAIKCYASRDTKRFIHFRSDNLSMLPIELEDLDREFSKLLEQQNVGINSFLDNSGVLWLGQTGLDLKKTYFHSSFEGEAIYGMYEDQVGRFWFDFEVEEVGRLKNDLFSADEYPSFVFQHSNTTYWALKNTRHGKTLMSFIVKSDVDGTHRVKNIKYHAVENEIVLKGPFFEDRDRNLWVATLGGILHIDTLDGTYNHYKYDNAQHWLDATYCTTAIHQDQAGVFWLATRSGLVRFTPPSTANQSANFKLYNHEANDVNSLGVDYVLAIEPDPDNPQHILWLGTHGGGLNRFDKRTQSFTRYTTKDGLPNNVVYGILSDEEGDLWLSTNNGLCLFNPKGGILQHFTEADGLQDSEFNRRAFLKSKNGTMYFGGINGLTSFDPKEVREVGKNPVPPPVVLTELRLNNQRVFPNDSTGILTQTIETTEALVLDYGCGILSFSFAALEYSNSTANQYAYKLEEYHDDWIYTGTTHQAVLPNLPPGYYTFRVKASNNDGVWNEEGTSLSIYFCPPWWMTWWAYSLWVLIALSIIGGLYYLQIKRIKTQAALKNQQHEAQQWRQLHRLKTQFFSNITHEFRTPLTLIIEPIKELIENVTDQKTLEKLVLVRRNGQRLLLLINQLLDLSKLENQAMKVTLSKGNPIEFIADIIESFQFAAQQRSISLHFQRPKPMPELNMDYAKLQKVCYNLLSNAIKFTPSGGEVSLHLDYLSETDNLQLSIKDSGIGIPTEELPHIFDRFYQVDGSHTRRGEGTGIGLALTKELVELMNGQIQVSSVLHQGTSFELKLPALRYVQETVETEIDVLPAIADVLPPATANAKEMPNPTTNSKRKVILIVEDNADIRNYLQQAFDATNYHILEAENGIIGLRKAAEHIPDLIITDLMMPELDGHGLVYALKHNDQTSHIPIIMLTAKSAHQSRMEGLELGVDAYLTKPFNIKELQVRVHKLLELRQSLRNYYQANGSPKAVDNPFPSMEQQFLQRAREVVEQYLNDEQFNAEQFSEKMAMSYTQLYRKLKALTDLSVSCFIGSIRLEHAHTLLKNKAGTISDIAYQVGFSSTTYFATCFKKRYGYVPSKLIKQQEMAMLVK